jgi:hypothetical protein
LSPRYLHAFQRSHFPVGVKYLSLLLSSLLEERLLAVFERKILRKIYGPLKENEVWRIRRNDELEDIIKGENIVRFIKSQRIRWLGHIERMQDTAIPKKMYGKLYVTRGRED